MCVAALAVVASAVYLCSSELLTLLFSLFRLWPEVWGADSAPAPFLQVLSWVLGLLYSMELPFMR